MIYSIIAIFSITAILGMILLGFVLKGKETPKRVVFSHGPLAAAGLALLIIYVVKRNPEPFESMVLFVIAALGGLIMFFRDIQGKSIPKWLGLTHGLLAVAGFLLLLGVVFL